MLGVLDPDLFVAAMAVFGLMIGSFLNVVVHRLPLMMEQEWLGDCHALLGSTAPPTPAISLARPRSRCPHCGTQLSALDNIPLLSYIALAGKCRHCAVAISLRYPLVELLAGLAGGYAAWHFAASTGVLDGARMLMALAASSYVWSLLALALIDYDTKLLPDSITQPLLWSGLVLSLAGVLPHDLETALIGALLGYLSLWSIYWLFKLVTGKEGMGYGDFKLLAALGAWLGWQALPAVILLSSVVGAVTGLLLMVGGRVKREVPIPFGPYLAGAGIIAMFWREPVMALFQSGPSL